ncbi:MAG: hypothetical protein ABWK01_04030 [Infirmifilum sp.]
MSDRPLLEVVADDDEEIIKALKNMGVSRIVAFTPEKIVYQYPPAGDVLDLKAFASSALAIMNEVDPWLALKQGSRSVIIFKKDGIVVAVEGVLAPVDYDAIVMLARILSFE